MTAAKAREKEKERVLDRKLIKEREQEEHLYGDLPKFVTSSYKAKLEADKRFNEAEEAKAAEEERRDKKQGMGTFLKTIIDGGPSSCSSRLQNTGTTGIEGSIPRDEAKGVPAPAPAPAPAGPGEAELHDRAMRETRRECKRKRANGGSGGPCVRGTCVRKHARVTSRLGDDSLILMAYIRCYECDQLFNFVCICCAN